MDRKVIVVELELAVVLHLSCTGTTYLDVINCLGASQQSCFLILAEVSLPQPFCPLCEAGVCRHTTRS